MAGQDKLPLEIFAEKSGIEFEFEFLDEVREQHDRFFVMVKHYKLTLSLPHANEIFGKRTMELDYHQGEGIKEDPTLVVALNCIALDCNTLEEKFEDWAIEVGYDPDSRKAEKIYNQCKQERKDFIRIAGQHMFDQLLEVEGL